MQSALILSVLAPALVATFLVAVGHRLWKRSGPVEAGRWSLALAPVLAAFAAYIAVRSFPELPPSDVSEWALWMGLVAAVFGIADGLLELPAGARWAARGLLSGLVAYLVLGPMIANTWSGGQAALWVIASTVAMVAGWTAIDRVGAHMTGPAVPATLLVLGTGVATVLGTSGSALLAQACGGVTVAFGVMAVAGLMRPELRLGRSVAGPTTLLFGGFLLAGLHYADVGGFSAGLLVVAPFALLIGLLPSLPSRGVRAVFAPSGLAVVLCGAAIGLSVVASFAPAASEASSDGYDDGYDGY